MEVQTNSVKRSVRTGVQGGAAGLILLAIQVFNIYDFTEEQAAVLLLILTPTIAFVQNFIENMVDGGLFRPKSSDEAVAVLPPVPPVL